MNNQHQIKVQSAVLIYNFFIQFAENSCLSPYFTPGTCVYLSECDQIVKILKKGFLSFQDRIFLGRSQCGFENGQVKVCCVDVHPASTTQAPVHTTAAPQKNTNNADSVLPAPGNKISDFFINLFFTFNFYL